MIYSRSSIPLGTTGEPKGVMLDYSNLAHQLEAHDIALDVNQDEVSLSFLPFSHILSVLGLPMCYIGEQSFVISKKICNQVREALTEVRPTFMCAVPRSMKKIYSAVLIKSKKRLLFVK